jgi:hypothetical protein
MTTPRSHQPPSSPPTGPPTGPPQAPPTTGTSGPGAQQPAPPKEPDE